MNDSWKLPVGSVFNRSLSAEEKSNLVKRCLTLLNSVGVNLTFGKVPCPKVKFVGGYKILKRW